jgi:hypothetical protein
VCVATVSAAREQSAAHLHGPNFQMASAVSTPHRRDQQRGSSPRSPPSRPAMRAERERAGCLAGVKGPPVSDTSRLGFGLVSNLKARAHHDQRRWWAARDEIVREDVWRMLAEGLKAEVDAYVAQFIHERDERGPRLVVGNCSHDRRSVLRDLAADGRHRRRAPAGLDRRQPIGPGLPPARPGCRSSCSRWGSLRRITSRAAPVERVGGEVAVAVEPGERRPVRGQPVDLYVTEHELFCTSPSTNSVRSCLPGAAPGRCLRGPRCGRRRSPLVVLC